MVFAFLDVFDADKVAAAELKAHYCRGGTLATTMKALWMHWAHSVGQPSAMVSRNNQHSLRIRFAKIDLY